jgi:phosphocarrier protein
MAKELRIEAKVTVLNEAGLHARPAAQLVHFMREYKCDATLHRVDDPDEKADLRSVLAILMLAAPKGCELVLEVLGEDADKAAEQIVDYFNRSFDED